MTLRLTIVYSITVIGLLTYFAIGATLLYYMLMPLLGITIEPQTEGWLI